MRRFILIYIICICAEAVSAQTLSDYLTRARTGDTTAQYNTAQCYLYGWGTKPDKGLWLHFLRLSAEGGEHRAIADLATHTATIAPDIASYWRGDENTIPYNYIYRSYNDGCYYGEFRRGERDGYGTYLWDNGALYTGLWDGGERYGVGLTRFEDMHIFNNLSNSTLGYGAIILTSPSLHLEGAEGSTRYVGYLTNGIPNGVGTLYNAAGEVTYYGEFSNGIPIETYPSTRLYTSYRWHHEPLPNGDSWEGEMVDNMRDGFGIYRWEDGSEWWGFWHNGVREGTGLYIRNDGALMSGTWENGELKIEN